jgi:tRNA G18 (ribose-2'-O)-methylase SpoU
LVAETCDELARLEIGPSVESLNVSVAAGIALYLLRRRPVDR